MKTAEFSYIKTPDEWKNIVRNYQKEDVEVLQKKLNETQKRSSITAVHRPIRVILIAAAIIVLSCGSVLAYDAISGNYRFELTRALRGLFSGADDTHVQNIGQSVTDGGLTVTCSNVIAQDDRLCFQIQVNTSDGSDLCNTKDTTLTQTFAEMELLVNGNAVEDLKRTYIRVDDGNVKDAAQYELTFSDYKDGTFLNQNVELQLKNVVNYHCKTNDIGITSNNLADLFAGVTFAEEASMELCEKTARSEAVDVYMPQEGNMNIHFSSKYPDCYIDNAGVGKYTVHGSDGSESKDMSVLYMTVTVANADEFDVMKNLICVNTQTGTIPSLNMNSMQVIDNERILIMLMPAKDYLFQGSMGSLNDNIIFTNDMLAYYNLVCVDQGVGNTETTTAYKGRWNFTFTVDDSYVDVPKTATNVDVNTAIGKAHIENVSVSNLLIQMQVELDDTNGSQDSTYETISLIYADGREETYQSRGIGSKGHSGDSYAWDMDIEWIGGKAIDLSDVTAIKFLGQEIAIQ